MDVTPEEVVDVMQRENVTQLIHGHTHRPDVHTLQVDGNPATRYVLGDWQDDLWYIDARSEDSIELISTAGVVGKITGHETVQNIKSAAS